MVAESHDVLSNFPERDSKAAGRLSERKRRRRGVERGKRLEKRDSHTACSLRETETNKLKLDKCMVIQKLIDCCLLVRMNYK